MQIRHQISQAKNKQAVNHDYVMTSLIDILNVDSLNNAM